MNFRHRVNQDFLVDRAYLVTRATRDHLATMDFLEFLDKKVNAVLREPEVLLDRLDHPE